LNITLLPNSFHRTNFQSEITFRYTSDLTENAHFIFLCYACEYNVEATTNTHYKYKSTSRKKTAHTSRI